MNININNNYNGLKYMFNALNDRNAKIITCWLPREWSGRILENEFNILKLVNKNKELSIYLDSPIFITLDNQIVDEQRFLYRTIAACKLGRTYRGKL